MENINVKEGQIVTCIKTVIMQSNHDDSVNGEKAFTKGEDYEAIKDACLRDNFKSNHWVDTANGDKWFTKHFKIKA